MARLTRFLGVVMRIRAGELAPVLLLFSWMFCLVGAIWLTRAVRDSLFLANVSAARLPAMYVAGPLTVSAFGFLYARIADRFRRDRLLVATAVAIAAVLLAARAAVGSGAWLYYALYVVADVAAAVAAMQFWTVAGEQFTSRDAKRLIGLIAAGGTVANIVIGFGVSGLARRAGAENLLFVCAGLFLGTGGLALALSRLYAGRLGRARAARPRGSRDPRGFAAPGAGHLRIVAAIAVCSVVTLTLLDFQFKTIAAASLHGDRVAMVRFFGVLSGITGCIALVMQLAITSRLLARVGVAGVLLILPCLLGLGSVLLVVAPGLAAATFCKATDSTLRYTVNDAGMQLVYLPVPARVRSRMKAVIDAIVRPGCEAGVGLLLLGARALALPLAALAAVAAVAAALWTACALRLRPAYVRSLRETLRRRRLELAALPPVREIAGLAEAEAEGDGEPEPDAPPAFDAAEPRRILANEDARPARRREAARALGHAATPEAIAILLGHLGTRDETVRGAVCAWLARAHRANPAVTVARAELETACRRELHAAFVAMAAAEGLGRAETDLNPDGTRAPPPFLRHEPEGAAALVSKALRERWERARDRVFHLCDVLHPEARLLDLARSLVDVDAARRANAVEALESVLPRDLRRVLVPLCDESPRYVKLNAVAGLLELPRRTRDAWLEELLTDDSAWMIACAVYYAGMHELAAARSRVAGLTAHASPVVREAAAAALPRLGAAA